MMREDRPKRLKRAAANSPPKTSRRNALATVVAIFAAYAALLLYAHGRVPPGLNNDVAEEALRGIYLVRGHHFEVMTFAVETRPRLSICICGRHDPVIRTNASYPFNW